MQRRGGVSAKGRGGAAAGGLVAPLTMQALWNECLHGNWRTHSPCAKSSRQMQHVCSMIACSSHAPVGGGAAACAAAAALLVARSERVAVAGAALDASAAGICQLGHSLSSRAKVSVRGVTELSKRRRVS